MTGRRISLGALLLTAMTLTACGGGAHFANHARPAVPVNVSVYINDQKVSVSPNSVTSGAVTITITNQASSSESFEVVPAGGSTPVIPPTGPINPQATDQVTVNLSSGQYTIGIAPNSSSQAAAATPTGIASGLLTVSGRRGNSNGQLLQP